MQQINRLLIRAKKATQSETFRYAVGLVEYDEEAKLYTATPQSCSGKTSAEMELATLPDYNTKAEAVEALHRLFDGYGIPSTNSVVFYVDYGADQA